MIFLRTSANNAVGNTSYTVPAATVIAPVASIIKPINGWRYKCSDPCGVWEKVWIVNRKAVRNGKNTVKYLSRYIFKVAISNSRIIKVEDREVFFKFRKNFSRRWRIMALHAMEFLRHILQHVLPAGFMKIRYYGFTHPASSVPLEKISPLIELAYGFEIVKPDVAIEPFEIPACTNCGGRLKYLASIRRFYPISAGPG